MSLTAEYYMFATYDMWHLDLKVLLSTHVKRFSVSHVQDKYKSVCRLYFYPETPELPNAQIIFFYLTVQVFIQKCTSLRDILSWHLIKRFLLPKISLSFSAVVKCTKLSFDNNIQGPSWFGCLAWGKMCERKNDAMCTYVGHS